MGTTHNTNVAATAAVTAGTTVTAGTNVVAGGKCLDESVNGTHGITVGSEAANVINVAVQLNSGNDDAAPAAAAGVLCYLSDDADGSSVVGTAPDGGVAIGTDGLLIPLVANKAFMAVAEADGDIDIDITESGTDTFYLVIVNPNGTIQVSGAITFAA